MEICGRNPEAEITEKLIEELTNQINQHIIDAIKNKFPYYYNYHCNNNDYLEPEKRKKYEDKFEIRIVGDNVMSYRVQHFIHNLIEEDLHKGKITRDDEHYKYEISLDNIHKVTYIYDPMFDKDKVIRYHQTEEEYKKLHEPFNISNELGLYLNHSKYIIKFDLI